MYVNSIESSMVRFVKTVRNMYAIAKERLVTETLCELAPVREAVVLKGLMSANEAVLVF